MVTPVTNPVVVLINAIEGLLLAHVPPLNVFDNEMVAPMQTDERPLMAGGVGSMITLVDTEHPDEPTKVIVTTPADMPVATPVDPIIVNPEDALQVPPVAAQLHAHVLPTQI